MFLPCPQAILVQRFLLSQWLSIAESRLYYIYPNTVTRAVKIVRESFSTSADRCQVDTVWLSDAEAARYPGSLPTPRSEIRSEPKLPHNQLH